MRNLVVRAASTIPFEATPRMSHCEYVNWDGHRIFRKMVSRAREFVSRPEWYVLYSPSDIKRIPPCPGVYIAFCEGGLCRYVGESCCVGRRVGPFLSRSELDGAKYIAFIPARDERERLAMELYWMGLLAPVNNKQLNPRHRTGSFRFDDLTWDDEEDCWRFKDGNTAKIDRNGNVK